MQNTPQPLVQLQTYLRQGQFGSAIQLLISLINQYPHQLPLRSKLAELYGQTNQLPLAIMTYEGLLKLKPSAPNTLFNYAFQLNKSGQFNEAISAYQKALDHQVQRPEEALLNMAVIYSSQLGNNTAAAKCLRLALQHNEMYEPAIMNLANLYEETGDIAEAIPLYQKIISLNPRDYEALSRLANAHRFSDNQHPVFLQLSKAAKQNQGNAFERSCLQFALGKAHNDIGTYTQAFKHYQQGNTVVENTMQSYNKELTEQYFDSIITAFPDTPQIQGGTNTEKTPIFICGMFRSGSTLNEQVLSGHPDITAGGEIDFFARLMNQQLSTALNIVNTSSRQEYREIAHKYLSYTEILYPKAKLVTDKRPDNFLYLGFIKQVFPQAKILHTTRNPLDTCLSIYFTQFGNGQSYARDLGNIAHYYTQYLKLMQHWKALFGADIYDVSYDNFVKNSDDVGQGFFSFLGLDWDNSFLDFSKSKNAVKTASVQQVRQTLYTSSSGRWQNYANELKDLRHFLAGASLL